MGDRTPREMLTDRYVRDELSTHEETAFENELLESPELQDDLESVLAMRSVLTQTPEPMDSAVREQPSNSAEIGDRGWRPLALAASVILAVLSTVMWWKSGGEVAQLENEIAALSAPHAEVLRVSVPIMRSSGGQTPDVIIQKPDGRAAVILDIELGLAARRQDSLGFALIDPGGEVVLAWESASTTSGHASAAISSEVIPVARLWLEISDSNGGVLERRLLEFRSRD